MPGEEREAQVCQGRVRMRVCGDNGHFQMDEDPRTRPERLLSQAQSCSAPPGPSEDKARVV